jgi:hypothetical protein
MKIETSAVVNSPLLMGIYPLLNAKLFPSILKIMAFVVQKAAQWCSWLMNCTAPNH